MGRVWSDPPTVPEPRFGWPVAPFHRVFAWLPVTTWDGRRAWLRMVWRRRIHRYDYLDGPGDDQWWQYTLRCHESQREAR